MAQMEAGHRITKAASPLKRYGTLADSLVRTKVADSPSHAARILQDSHPNLVRAAQREDQRMQADESAGWDNDGDVGKSDLVSFRKDSAVRVNKSAVTNDARLRLQAIIERLVQSGMDGRAAEFRARQANPELWEMACGNPSGSEDLTPDSSNHRPSFRQRNVNGT
jgi:hypothetical protein